MKQILNNRLAVKTIVCALGIGLAAFSVNAGEAKENRGQFTEKDYKFACEAARGGAMEVSLGRLATQKASDDAVKQFGQRMVDDHGKAGRQLQELASQKGVSLPTESTATEQRHIDKLNSLSGTEFDSAYVSLMTADHKKDLKAFKHEAEKGDDADLKNFAASTAPVVEEHLKMLESMPPNTKRVAAQ